MDQIFFLSSETLKWIIGVLISIVPAFIAARTYIRAREKEHDDEIEKREKQRQLEKEEDIKHREEFQRRVSEALAKADEDNEKLRTRLNILFDDYEEITIKLAKTESENVRLKGIVDELRITIERLKATTTCPMGDEKCPNCH